MYLCGVDSASGQSFEHRRQWVVDRILFLAEHYCIDVCAYAVMHNHYHIVLHVDRQRALSLKKRDVIKRYREVHLGSSISIDKFLSRNASKIEKKHAKETVGVWRKRLFSISWFMRDLNEFIAKKANAETGHKGHFWEERFRSQALLDGSAVLNCMAYVDLNPIRAGITKDLESSDFTSIQLRVRSKLKAATRSSTSEKIAIDRRKAGGQLKQLTWLLDVGKCELNISEKEYLEFVNLLGCHIIPSKKGHIVRTIPEVASLLKPGKTQVEEIFGQFNSFKVRSKNRNSVIP